MQHSAEHPSRTTSLAAKHPTSKGASMPAVAPFTVQESPQNEQETGAPVQRIESKAQLPVQSQLVLQAKSNGETPHPKPFVSI